MANHLTPTCPLEALKEALKIARKAYTALPRDAPMDVVRRHMFLEEQAEVNLAVEEARLKLHASDPKSWYRIDRGVRYGEDTVEEWFIQGTTTNQTDLIFLNAPGQGRSERRIAYAEIIEGRCVFVTCTNKIFTCDPTIAKYRDADPATDYTLHLERARMRPVHMEYGPSAE
jgi:hypothetical protein